MSNSPATAQQAPLLQTEPGVNPPRPDIAYEGSKANQRLQIVNLFDVEAEAQKIMHPGGFGYVFGGSGANWTRRENMEAFNRVNIEPQALSGVAKVDLATEILGSKLSMPIFIPPMGSHGIAHVDKEAATATRRGGGRHPDDDVHGVEPEHGGDRVPQSRPEVVPALCADRPRLYPRARPARQGRRLHRDRADRRQCLGLSARGEHPQPVPAAADARPRQPAARRWTPPQGSKMLDARKRDLNWADLEWIKKEAGLPIIVKGVQSAKAAQMAVKVGLDAVWVSNHGGRAFDGVQATITVLPRIAQAVDGRVPIILDGGVRRGNDVFKALALGANCGRLRPAGHVRAGARRHVGRAERARTPARQPHHRDAARRHAEHQGDHARLPRAACGRVGRAGKGPPSRPLRYRPFAQLDALRRASSVRRQ